jgi:hypothetical protein
LVPPKLGAELDSLKASGYIIEVVEEDASVNLIFRDFPTKSHFNNPTTTLLVRIPRSYPDAGPDMFWTDPALLLVDNAVPKNGELIESYCGRQWRRFSWHHSGWNPTVNNLTSYVAFVKRRFDDK